MLQALDSSIPANGLQGGGHPFRELLSTCLASSPTVSPVSLHLLFVIDSVQAT